VDAGKLLIKHPCSLALSSVLTKLENTSKMEIGVFLAKALEQTTRTEHVSKNSCAPLLDVIQLKKI
jgi:hypothetical protein